MHRLHLALGLLAAGLIVPDVSAQHPGAQPSVISGTVVIPGGRPAAGATVWLIKSR